MNELDFLRDVEGLEFEDKPSFDVFAKQFNSSLPESDEEEELYWHGRLIGTYVEDLDTKRLKNYEIFFLGNPFNEKKWRAALKSGEISIEDLTFTEKPQYSSETAPAGNLNPHKVVYKAHLKASVDGKDIDQDVTVEHHIRLTYLAYRTVINFPPPPA